jgi:hypothetical protein
MPEVKTRRSVFVRATLDATGQFDYVINIPFHVDDMHLNSWTVGTGANDQPFVVEMVGVGEICSMTEEDFDSPRHVFNINRSITGVQRFTLRSAAGTIIDRTGVQIFFCLEFIEFHRN